MQPQPLVAAHVGQRRERIDGAGVGRAGVGDDRPRQPAGGAVLGDGAAQAVRRQAEVVVGRHGPDLVRAQADDLGRPIDRPVPLLGDVEDGPAAVLEGEPFAGHDQGGQVGLGAAAGQDAGASGG